MSAFLKIYLPISMVFFTLPLHSQDYEVIHHDLSEFFFRYNQRPQFASDANGDLWYLYQNTLTAVREKKLYLYDGNEWNEIPFDECDYCIETISHDSSGDIYIGTEFGIFKRADEEWELVNDGSEVRNIGYSSDGGLWWTSYLTDSLFVMKNEEIEFIEVLPGPVGIMHGDELGNLWLSYLDQEGIYFGDPGISILKKYNSDGITTFEDGMFIAHMDIDSKNRVWINFDDGENTINYNTFGYYDDDIWNPIEIEAITNNNLISLDAFATDLNDKIWFNRVAGDLEAYADDQVTAISNDTLYPDEIHWTGFIYIHSNNSKWVGPVAFSNTLIEVIDNPTISSTLDVTFSRNNFNVFPVPSDDNITLEFENYQDIFSITIYNLEGHIVKRMDMDYMQEKLKSYSISIADLQKGTYYVMVVTDSKEYYFKEFQVF